MIQPEWQSWLPKLRYAMDQRELKHIKIVERTDGDPMNYEQILDTYGTSYPYIDEYVTFEPLRSDWRQYRIMGTEPDAHWYGEAEKWDFQNTPSISFESDELWHWDFAYDGGSLSYKTYSCADTLLDELLDYLEGYFTDPLFTLAVTVEVDGFSWSHVPSGTMG